MAQIENPTFVFSPQIPNQSQSLIQYLPNYWVPTVSLILDSLIHEFPIDTTRIYITGLSLGGMNTWGFIYLNESERFAAAIPMSGGWVPIDIEPQITDIPIWAFCGVSDEGNINYVRDIISTIESAGYLFERIFSTYGNIGLTIDEIASLNQLDQRHIYTEFTDGGHVIWDKTYDDPALHYWLFSQKRDSKVTHLQFESAKRLISSHLLYDNYPNPFNPSTTINYSIPQKSFVSIKVYNALGAEIIDLVNEKKSVGNYKVEFDGSELTSGIYFYRLQAGDFVQTKKMILLK